MSNNKTVIVIPARFASTRFPGKLLQRIGDKSVIRLVHEKALRCHADEVWIATDSSKIQNEVESFGGNCVMTSIDHQSGTDRIWEAIQKIQSASGKSFELVVNLQGDEPLIDPEVVNRFIEMMLKHKFIKMGTIAVTADRQEIAEDPNKVKAVIAHPDSAEQMARENFFKALYFTRAAAPFLRDGGSDAGIYLHWGIYGYQPETLEKIVGLPESCLEKCEKLEQLRALENGIDIYVMTSTHTTCGIDTPEDLEKVRRKCGN